jgi:hypothetical protein
MKSNICLKDNSIPKQRYSSFRLAYFIKENEVIFSLCEKKSSSFFKRDDLVVPLAYFIQNILCTQSASVSELQNMTKWWIETQFIIHPVLRNDTDKTVIQYKMYLAFKSQIDTLI